MKHVVCLLPKNIVVKIFESRKLHQFVLHKLRHGALQFSFQSRTKCFSNHFTLSSIVQEFGVSGKQALAFHNANQPSR